MSSLSLLCHIQELDSDIRSLALTQFTLNIGFLSLRNTEVDVKWKAMQCVSFSGVGGKVPKSTKHSPEKKKQRKKKDLERIKKSRSSPSHLTNMHDSDEERENNDYQTISIQVKRRTICGRVEGVILRLNVRE